MIIERRSRRRLWAFAALGAAALAVAGSAHATSSPTAVTDLSASSGPVTGSIVLKWTAPAGDLGTDPVSRYAIRYLVNSPIYDSNFDQSSSIQDPPIVTLPPPPANPGLPQFLNLNGLTTGVTYYFAIAGYDSAGIRAPLATSATIYIANACGASPFDGLGMSTWTVLPDFTGFRAGTPLVVDTMFRPDPVSGIAAGGLIQMRVPDGWSAPQMTDSSLPGFLSLTPGPGVSFSSVSVSGQAITVQSAVAMSSTTYVRFRYTGGTCRLGATTFRFLSQNSSCGQLRDISNNYIYFNVRPGYPASFNFDNFDIPIRLSSPTPVVIRARDNCGFLAASTTTFNLSLAGTLGTGSFVADPNAVLADNPGMSSPFSLSGGTIPVSPSSPLAASATLWYRLDSAGNSPNDYIRLQYQIGAQTPVIFAHAVPLTVGITGTSVDTGVLTPGQTSVTFTPDGDGNADTAFINFTMPTSLNWRVTIATSGASTPARTFTGFGNGARLAWDGFQDYTGGTPTIAPSGTYLVTIADQGGFLTDSSLSITLSAGGIAGQVIRSDNSSALSDVDIDIAGPTHRYARTDSNGNYSVGGLLQGSYSLRFSKTGFSTLQNVSVSVGNGVANKSVALDPQAILHISAVRPPAASLPEVWGSVQANTSDWRSQSYGTIHFADGKLESDAGDVWDAVRSSYTDLTLEPGKTYSVRFNVPNYATPAFATGPFLAGDVLFQQVSLQRYPNIEGLVSLSTADSANPNPLGTYVSIEAGPDANGDGQFDTNDPSKHYFGGTFIPAGALSENYEIFGVATGTYLLIGRAQNFVQQQITNVKVTSLINDATGYDFPPFSQGGSISGTITIEGDTTGLDALDGTTDGLIRVDINAWSSSGAGGSQGEVMAAASSTGTVVSYVLRGLLDGTYDLYVNLPSYEADPPGRITATVSGGVGSRDMSFKRFSGVLTGAVTLPGTNTDYSNVKLQLLPFDTGGGSNAPVSVTASAGTYTFSGLGTGFYTLRAFYVTTGLIVEKSVRVSNGNTTTQDVSMTGTTYTLSGTVTTSANSPFNSLAYAVNSTTPTQITDAITGTAVVPPWPANRIMARRVTERDFYDNQQSDQIDTRSVFYATYDANGSYSFPHLSPGVYRVYPNGEMDGDSSDGRELAEFAETITIAGNTVHDITLTDGYSVAGDIRVKSGDAETGRNLSVSLQDNSHQNVASANVYLTGTSVSFSLENVANGSYLLSVYDFQSPRKYVARDLPVVVNNADKTGLQVDLLRASRIQGQFRLATSSTLVTAVNYQSLLPGNIRVEARANPWFSGGDGQADDPLIDASGRWTVAVPPGVYDLLVYMDGNGGAQGTLSAGDIAQGKRQIVPIRLAGIQVAEGQTRALGIVDLREGAALHGTVKDGAGHAVSNVHVIAIPSGQNNVDPLEAYTDNLGQYTIVGIDKEKTRYYDVIAAPRPNSDDARYAFDFDGPLYGEVRKKRVDSLTTPSVDFTIQPAPGKVTGTVQAPAGGPQLFTPFGDQPQPGAEIIMNKVGNIPSDNPLGDIDIRTKPDGTFTVDGLAAGVYDLYALAEGYSNAFVGNINVGTGVTSVGTLTVGSGNTLYGTLTKPDGSAVNESEVSGLVAVRDGFRDLIIAKMTADPAGNIQKYELPGFKQDLGYDIVAIKDNDVTPLAQNVILNQTSAERDFVISPQAPSVLTETARNADGTLSITFVLSRPMANREDDLDGNGIQDDSDLAARVKMVSGTGVLTATSDGISSDRERLSVTYAPGPGETTFTLNVNLTFADTDVNGDNFTANQNFVYFIGIGKSVSSRITSVSGGSVNLDDNSEFSAQTGTFEDDTVDVTFRSASTVSDLASAEKPLGAKVMANASAVGLAAYPTEMAGAIAKLRARDINPFSSFYDIFLPAGVKHFFPEGREAQLCLAYDSSVPDSDAYALNVYYYNSASDQYLLEGENKAVDTLNHRVCVSVAHASVFTVLASSESVLSGAGYTGELALMNFPNPFDLKPKTVTLQNPGSNAPSQNITGTMIKMSIPPNLSGEAEIQIFNVAGEKVRTIKSEIPTGGAHYYVEWDGKNDSGADVASGTYIARFTLGGGNERFFKMAVLK